MKISEVETKDDTNFRLRTKGKFNDNVAPNAGYLYQIDQEWKQKSNPEVHQMERSYI